MNYLLDTNRWSHLQRNHPAVVARVRDLPDDANLYMPVIAQGELLAGIELMPVSARRQRLEDWYRENVARDAAILPVTPDVARHYARIFAALRNAGTPIETNDIWIAAIAVAYNLVVVSTDNYFRYVPGLVVEDWTLEGPRTA